MPNFSRYNFVDKDGCKVTLRPEMTPSLARMVLSLMREETGQMSAMLPLKWYSIPQCWRFETTQRGRKREHYQWNMDVGGRLRFFRGGGGIRRSVSWDSVLGCKWMLHLVETCMESI